MPEVAAPSEIKDDTEGLKREAEKEVDVSERKKRKWEEEKDSSTSDSNKIAVRIMLFIFVGFMLPAKTVVIEPRGLAPQLKLVYREI